jgi:hypothetical protein
MQKPAIAILLFTFCVAGAGHGQPGPSMGEDPGALVGVSMHSSVGVVLDEIPETLRDQAAAYYLARGNSF